MMNRCHCSQGIDHNHFQMVTFDRPLMIFHSPTPKQRPLVLNPYGDAFIENPLELELDTSHFQHENEKWKTDRDLSENRTDSRKENVKLSSLESCAPELGDKNQLSEINERSDYSNISEESDKEAVIFVEDCEVIKKDENKKSKDCSEVRRNPVRSVRNKSKILTNEVIFEEDFVFLETSDDEMKIDEKSHVVELPKEWPVNVHERPEYNATTKKIEPFDYTIRDIQKTATITTKLKEKEVIVRKNPKRKPTTRRKPKPTIAPEPPRETVPISELKSVINSTTEMLKNYFFNSKKHQDLISKSSVCTLENKVKVLRNQAFLFAIVNNLDERQIADKFKHINLDNEANSIPSERKS
ncbi:uncharacterized protein LOC130898583 isoform X2 [Diorhabda carinulata]|nr:uncharacterized protein LOC130898583 isoform X2 [Diorhabda carinulata]